MQKQKIEKLCILIRNIKKKIEEIQILNKNISSFNFKLEALIYSLEEVSFTPTEIEGFLTSTPNNFLNQNISNKTEEIIMSPEDIVRTKKQNFKKDIYLEDVLESVYNIIPDNALYRTNADKLIRFLFNNKGGVIYEEILKKSGVPKYRCIDILNLLMNADPPVVTKAFEKGITYKLNLE